MPLTRPQPILKPFAESGDKNTIPLTSEDPGAASWELGFPPDTMIDVGAGGIAPDGLDVNGILNIITQHVRFMLAGGYPRFDAALCAEIGGYPPGAVLQGSIAGENLYRNNIENNTTDFNTHPESIGVSWFLIAAPPNSVVAGTGLITGGSLATGDVTLNLGTPGTCSITTTNAATADSHTHALTLPGATSTVVGLTRYATGNETRDMSSDNFAVTPAGLASVLVDGSVIKKIGKTVFQTGISGGIGTDSNVTLTFPEAFSSTPVVVPYMINSSTSNDDVFARVVAVSATQCTLRAECTPSPSNSGTRQVGYLAIGTIN